MDEEAVGEEVFSTSSLVELLHDGITIYLTERVSIAILTPL